MKVFSKTELKENEAELAEKISKGESFVVFRKSKPIFEISPVGDGLWEEVIDFTKIKKGGINVKDILKRL